MVNAKEAFTYSHDLPPATNSSAANEKHIFEETKSVTPSDASSFWSTTTTLSPGTIPYISPESFQPATLLTIAAHGMKCVTLPLPSSELTIHITRSDGTLAYTSTRATRRSGDSILSTPTRGDVVGTKYFFGMGRDPEITLLDGSGAGVIKPSGKWTSRTVEFTDFRGRVFEWGYASTKDSERKKVNVIALRVVSSGDGEGVDEALVKGKEKSKGGAKEGKILAQLIRSEETRTQGTKRRTAGNGGVLLLSETATEYLDESLVVATCLMMLKKEIDRRRMLQMAVIAGAASGGS